MYFSVGLSFQGGKPSKATINKEDCIHFLVIEEKNIGLFQPKKDACDICTAYDTGNLSQEEKETHDSMEKEARMEKEKDKMLENEIFTMDLQSILLCPKSNVSSLYYKTKLIVHNFTVYDLKIKNGFCFLWNETEGRNTTLSNALLNLSINSNVTIIQKFLQRGHTQMEVDSMHSTIERKVRNRKINVPADYISICKSACIKSPYTVEYLTHNFFKSYSSITFCKSIRPRNKKGDPIVTNLKVIKYELDRQIKYKLRFTEEDWSTLKLKNSKQIAVKFDELPQLHNDRLKIKKEKYEHLQQLKLTMEKYYHAFFDNLPK
ncbi:Uncharacterized protein FWK35_00033566, partial [Aphis craccivora]